ncbi:MAG: RraA family protein [Candidatus Bipolaricaulis sp.]|nr:RraA family protein [Candidatus Bipolaricaulis sp.]
MGEKALRELRELAKGKLYVAAVCDILDELGYRNQAMHQRLRPLDPENCTFIGPARTVHWMAMEYVVEDDPYGLELAVMDDLKPGEVPVHNTDYGGTNAPWGELMSTAAVMRGAVGCVCDSQIRDCRKIIDLRFPVFMAGIRPLDSRGRGRVMAYDVPITCGGVLVKPGDIVYADFDGVVVIPLALSEEVLELALQKVEKENLSRQELLEGRLLKEVYTRYGVL